MGKVIAFDRNRLRSKSQPGFAHRTTSQAGSQARSHAQAGSGSRIHAFPQRKEEIQVSIIIPACGQPQLLSQCLASLTSQKFEAGRYEIIVVDAGPNTSTRDIVADWAQHASRHGPSISHLPLHGSVGTAAARNRGWRVARGHIVAFLDEDVIVRSDWLEKAWDAFDEDVGAVWGRIMSPVEKSSAFNTISLPPEQQSVFQISNYFVRKETLHEVGGFDERFTAAWGEEADLYFRLAEQPRRVVHHPRLIASHTMCEADAGKLLAKQRQHLWMALLYKKHPQLYQQKIRSLSYWNYYAVTIMLLLALVGFMAGVAALGSAALLAWLGLSLRLARRQRHKADADNPRLLSSMASTVLGPPLAVFWHVAGMLRFRTAYF